MPVVRRIQHIKSAHSLWKCVQHVQYPALAIPSMEFQALEWIRAHMQNVFFIIMGVMKLHIIVMNLQLML